MKKEINRLIDTGILNPELIVTFGCKDYQKFMQGQEELTTDGVSNRNATCEFHNSQATTPPSACNQEQVQLDVIEYHDEIMVMIREYTPETKLIIDLTKEINNEENEARLRFEKIDTASTKVNDDATIASGPFQPSSPHYLPDSDVPSNVRSTYTLETEEYSHTTSLKDIDTIGSANYDDATSNEPMRQQRRIKRDMIPESNLQKYRPLRTNRTEFPTEYRRREK